MSANILYEKIFNKIRPSSTLTLFVPVEGANFPPLSYSNIASKLKKSFAVVHSDFESILITHI